MTKGNSNIFRKGISGWLVKITLILTLITFSGDVSGRHPGATTFARAALTTAGYVEARRTTSYKAFSIKLRCRFPGTSEFKEGLIYGLLRYETVQRLSHTTASKEHAAARKPVVNFKIVNGNDNPDDHHTHESRG